MIYPIGNIGGIIIYVDPYMLWNDTNIYIGRKIKESEPGIKFYFKFKDTEVIMQAEGVSTSKLILRMRCAMPVIGENAQYQYRKIEYKPNSKLF
jgi:hypothetical protein